MTFFYTTSAGAVDFIILLCACCVAVVFSNEIHKKLAAILFLSFLIDRTALLFSTSSNELVFWASINCVLAVFLTVRAADKFLANAFSALYGVKVFSYALITLGFISFDLMASIVTAAVYGHILILFGGAVDGPNGGRISRTYRTIRSLHIR